MQSVFRRPSTGSSSPCLKGKLCPMEAAVRLRHPTTGVIKEHISSSGSSIVRVVGTRTCKWKRSCATSRHSVSVSNGAPVQGVYLGRKSPFRRSSTASADSSGALGVVIPASVLHVSSAVAALLAGEVIAVPTDTLYGLACDACSPSAIGRIYEIKSRDQAKSLAVCVADVEDVSRYATTRHLPGGLLEQLLPGPVTLVLPRDEGSQLHPALNPGVKSVGVRIPQSEFIRGVARSFGKALALTSANVSGTTSTVCVDEFQSLWQHCAHVFDAGTLSAGRLGSTVVDLTVPGLYQIIRSGGAMEATDAVLRSFGMEMRT